MRSPLVALALVLAALSVPAGAEEPPARALIVAARSQYIPAFDYYQGQTRMARVEMVIPRGIGIIFKNFDSLAHNIVSGEIQKVASPELGDGFFRSVETNSQDLDGVVVDGVESLAPGSYPFYCFVHYGSPTGVLVVV